MIITRLSGGLGNQMFQYAAARAYSLRTGYPFALDIFDVERNPDREYELNNFFITPQFVGVWHRVRNNGIIVDERVTTPEHFTSMTLDHLDMIGYWQDENYFKDYKNQITADFRVSSPMDEKNRKMRDQICSCIHPVSIHIRRGDYVGNPVHPVQDLKYYQNAMAIIESKLKEVPDYFIFSDEPVTYYFKNLSNFHFVNINDAHHGYCDLELMKHCEHHIIANSSFSWWGAWLGYNPDRLVIAPKLWFNSDQHRIQIPEKWIRI